VDEAIMATVVEGTSPRTLRFYAWSPPCLSLGRNQNATDVNLAACRAAGVDVVRRPSGGRAILHTDELTYSITILQSDPLAAGGVVESYRRLSEGLLSGLRSLGIPAVQAIDQREPDTDLTAVCFETPSNYEITSRGRKLVGSAQWRARGGVLQHGTLPLWGDIVRILPLLALPESEKDVQNASLRASATPLEQEAGRTIPFGTVSQALADGFSRVLGIVLIPGHLSPDERALARELRSQRYAAQDWTFRARPNTRIS
jgi:lipoate-protein ligase A